MKQPPFQLLLFLFMLTPTCLLAQTPSRRAEPPTFPSKDPDGIFFEDVFREGLVGERPANLSAAIVATPNGGGNAGSSSGEGSGGDGLYQWSGIISATTVENEIKARKLMLDKDVTTPGKFKGGGYKLLRKHCSVVAMLFAIAAEYDGDIRWKNVAPGARDVFGRTAGNAKVGTDQVYNEAKLRRDDLRDLVGGASWSPPKEGTPKADWSLVCDRSPLMQHISEGMKNVVSPGVANAADFAKNKDSIAHQAELIAAVGEVLAFEGMEDGEDDDYAEFSHTMRDAAKQLVEGVKTDNYDKARSAAGAITQSCDECHELYRG